MNKPIYPHVIVQLSGKDGNAFVIVGNVLAAMQKAEIPQEKIDDFVAEAMSDDYNKLLQTAMKYVTVY